MLYTIIIINQMLSISRIETNDEFSSRASSRIYERRGSFFSRSPAAPRASAFSRAHKKIRTLPAFLNGRAEKSSANTADQFALKSR